jgi:hypothetical protein
VQQNLWEVVQLDHRPEDKLTSPCGVVSLDLTPERVRPIERRGEGVGGPVHYSLASQVLYNYQVCQGCAHASTWRCLGFDL